jgi:transposase InsO family protein
VTKYTFIDAQKADFAIRALCCVLGVAESSYFDWNAGGRARHEARMERKSELEAQIRVVHADSDRTYGSPRVHAALRDAGVEVGLRRVAETMADAGITGLSGREHSTATTRRDRMAAPFPDLFGRNFTPLTPNALWYGDVTYIWIVDKFWYLATVIDAATKELLGWSFADHMRTSLVTSALDAAVRRRGGSIPAGVIFHSDRGSTYTSDEYGAVCESYDIRQ